MSPQRVEVQLPPKLIPVFLGQARYRGAYGGRGSAKTRSFAKMAAIHAHRAAQAGKTGIVLCVRQFMNSLAESSMAEIKAAIDSEEWLRPHFDIGEGYIRTICGKVEFVFVGLARNLDSIKSKARILLCWADEAEPIVEDAWVKLIPTVREDNSEIWVTWNREIEDSPTDLRFLKDPPSDAKIVEMNYRDNPWFPAVLEQERLNDKAKRPHSYQHIWGGAYKTYFEGAYYTAGLTEAREQGRIGVVPEDPHLIVRLYADIGGTGAKADNFVFWAAQHVGLTVRYVNHYEVQGQPIAAHLAWMRSQGYTPDRCKVWLPHDGETHDRVFDVSYRSAFESVGYTVDVIQNQGKGAAMLRVERMRELFPKLWFDETKCSAGLKAIAAYHEKKDPNRNVGLGPDHDGNSHSADAFGLSGIAYEEPRAQRDAPKNTHAGAGGWMG